LLEKKLPPIIAKKEHHKKHPERCFFMFFSSFTRFATIPNQLLPASPRASVPPFFGCNAKGVEPAEASLHSTAPEKLQAFGAKPDDWCGVLLPGFL